MVKERKLSDQPVSNSKDESGPELLIKELEQGVNQLVKLVASGSKERHGSYMRKASQAQLVLELRATSWELAQANRNRLVKDKLMIQDLDCARREM
eukprot:CAMPEP_0202965980 /NCGR_PEP_ID=MMETSP1396-20130829/10167_1 /ASSEMBLY_ACC=CAM_ASM_000872 /TAXON_ID= /ORGANISM="Pseudokeronopsis sp., Strain Brazil" /LENGTH=95 /DNA_ID=CAMNT_0049689279 /DNA_START=576 /DNA_END=864 /DNA_ORIENTATION=-